MTQQPPNKPDALPGQPVTPGPLSSIHAAPTVDRGGFKRGFGAGFGWALGAGVVALVIGVITTGIFGIAMLGLGALSPSAPTSTAVTVWGDEAAGHTVLAIPVTGVILGDSAGQSPLFGQGVYGYDIAAQLDQLEAGDADAVILEFNTPGGTIYGSKAIADAVERYQERTDKPVVAYVRGMSASGGMYAMAGADKIIVDHGTMVGSIGIIMGPFERYRDVTSVDGGLLSGGVTANGGIDSYYLTRGKGKDLGNPFRDMTPEERANLDTMLDADYQGFVQHVASNRNISPETIVNSYGAFVFGPKQAIENKLADAEMGQDDAYREAAELANVDPDDTKVQMEQPEVSFVDVLLGSSSQARPSSESAQAELAQGRAAIRASGLCVGEAAVLAFSGDLSEYCSE